MSEDGTPDWLDAGWTHSWLPYAQMQTAELPPAAVETRGTRIRLADGRELLDGMASWWTACHGYNHPHIVAAMQDQLRRMPHVMFGGLANRPAFDLARRLAALLPGRLERVFFSDSGSVAVEVALKMALQYWINRGRPERARFLCFRGAYHGDTMGAMSVSDAEAGMHHAFSGWLPRQVVAAMPKDARDFAGLDALLDRHGPGLAAVIVEPLVQGAGGMLFHEPSVLAGIRERAAAHGALLIADEVFTGFGRTGTMFACEAAGVVPDILCLGKGMTGGAIGHAATVATEEVYDAFLSEEDGAAFMHGPTFMANPLACAAANASLDLFEREDRLGAVAAIADWLADGLAPCREIAGIRDVRVKGAIGVVELVRLVDLAWLRRRFIEEGVWIRPFDRIVYLTPAFIATEGEIAQLTGAIRTVLAECAGGPRVSTGST